jgi:beta-lactamase regulating signal transducer with metallopeptidase domain
VGLWRARIVVPRWVLALPGPQRRYVLRHEDEHRRSRDALLLFAASLAVVLTPWNLALYWQLRRLRLAVEMDCDARVVRALGDAPAYGALLLDIAQAASRAPRPRRLQPAFLGGADSLEARLRRLVGPARPRGAARVLAPLAAAFLLLLALTVPHPVLARDAARAASAPHAHGR